ncbi:hypothetical protein ACS0TY_018869 [Phlomoides rotata]
MEGVMLNASRCAAIHLFRRGFANKPHNFARGKRRTSCPTFDFSSIRQGNDVIRLFREMVATSPQPSVRVYNNLLSVVVKMEEYAVALSLFDKMRHSSLPVDEFTMNIIINCCCHLNRVDFGFAVLGSFLKQGYKPDVTTFNTLLKGLFLVGNIAKAEALFNKVFTFRLCEPQDVMILTVINGLCKAGQTLIARNLLGAFEKAGYKPDVKSYNAVIDGLCKEGMVDDALHLQPEISEKGIHPDVFTYTSIIDGLCKDGMVDDALQSAPPT